MSPCRLPSFLLVALLGGWLLALSATAGAARLDRLYESEVPVAAQTTEERQNGIRLALERVLVRVTGQRNAAQLPESRPLLSQPGRYVQQFRYRMIPADERATSDTPLRLWVRFDAASLERGLRDAGLPFWGGERPETLVWLALERDGRRELVSELSGQDVKAPLLAAARRRGLPLVFPLMDLEDRDQVSFTDVWGGFMDSLVEASVRYRPQALLVARLYQERSGNWSARWTLRVQGADRSWSDGQLNLNGLLSEGLDVTADELATRFAIQDTGSGTSLYLAVEGVEQLEDYARLNRYLLSLTPVVEIQLMRLAGSRAEYQVWLQGDETGFDRALSIQRRLEPLEGLGRNYRLRP